MLSHGSICIISVLSLLVVVFCMWSHNFKKQSAQQLKESEDLYRKLIYALPDIVVITDISGKILFISPRLIGEYGFQSSEEIIGENILDFISPTDKERAADSIRRIVSGEILGAVEYNIIPINRRIYQFEINGDVLYNNVGKPHKIVLILRNISRRKQVEEKLKQTEERAQLMFNHHKAMMIIVESTTGKILDSNYAADVFYGTSLKGKYIHEISALPAEELAKQVIKFSQIGEQHFAARHYLANGEKKDIMVHLTTKALHGMALSFASLEDVTERLQMEKMLRSAKEKAERANKAKNEFIAAVSHELRTPMNGILGMNKLVLETQLSSEQRELLEMVHSSAEKLLGVLNDLLDFAKIKDGKLNFENRPFLLQDMLFETYKLMRVKAEEKGLKLVLNIAPDIPNYLKGDSLRLQQIIINLVGNSIKFTENGKIAINIGLHKSEPEKTILIFEVKDTGIGIPEHMLQDVFQRFTQVDSSTTRKYGGTGLGLSIAKELVAKMGGCIWVESKLGMGSTFYFTVELGMGSPLSDDFTQLNGGPCRIDQQSETQKLSILLAEDDFINQKIAIKVLEKRGHQVTLAEDGHEAVELFKKTRMILY